MSLVNATSAEIARQIYFALVDRMPVDPDGKVIWESGPAIGIIAPIITNSATAALTQAREASIQLREEIAGMVPRSRYDACNQDWLDEKEGRKQDRERAVVEWNRFDAEVKCLQSESLQLHDALERMTEIADKRRERINESLEERERLEIALTDQQPATDNCQHCGEDLARHHHRNLRCPTGETVFRAHPTPPQAVGTVDALVLSDGQLRILEQGLDRGSHAEEAIVRALIAEVRRLAGLSEMYRDQTITIARHYEAELAALRGGAGPAEMPKPPNKVLRYNRETGRIEADGISITPQEAEGEF